MLVTRPPMGFNTWNTFAEHINEQMIKEIADAMVEGGFRDAGYEYLVIDDCWSKRERLFQIFKRLSAIPKPWGSAQNGSAKAAG